MAESSGHTLKAFDDDLDRLRALISEMGGLAEHAIRESMRCLQQRDVEGAARIVENDKQLDALEIETEKRAVQLIALRAPMAGDLRDVVAALKISGVVERIGDYAKNIAKRVPLIESAGRIEPLSLLPEMARLASGMVHDVLNAFVERDAQAALSVCERDDAVDDFYDSIFRALLTHMMENPHNIGQAAHLLFVAKNLERVGDHATNIAEMVYYQITGEDLASRQLHPGSRAPDQVLQADDRGRAVFRPRRPHHLVVVLDHFGLLAEHEPEGPRQVADVERLVVLVQNENDAVHAREDSKNTGSCPRARAAQSRPTAAPVAGSQPPACPTLLASGLPRTPLMNRAAASTPVSDTPLSQPEATRKYTRSSVARLPAAPGA
jgi:phosphate transport system protein